jgi:hypothetical protein
MKKVILLCAVFCTLAYTAGLAQTEPIKKGNEWQMPKDVLIRSRDFTDHLKKTLALDDVTAKKVFNAYLGNSKTVDEIRMGKGSEKEKKDALVDNEGAFDQILKGLLSPEQFNKYLQNKKKMNRV